MLAGLGSAIFRHETSDGTDAFNLGVDFKGGTVVTTNSTNRLQEAIRATLAHREWRTRLSRGTRSAHTFLIKVPLEGASGDNRSRKLNKAVRGFGMPDYDWPGKRGPTQSWH